MRPVSLLPALFVFFGLASSQGWAGEPRAPLAQGNPATPEVPAGGPVADPAMPSLELRLPDYSLQSRDLRFASGLRVILQSDHSQPIVSITMVIDRGSTTDPAGKEGIAHFVEHLWFRSKQVDPVTQGRLTKVWDLLAELGCDLNASTADDWTNFMTVAPVGALPALMRLESLRLGNAVEGVEPEVVDTEREVIRNELRMRYDNTWMAALPYLFEHLYPEGHPYARLGIGTHESLNNITLADIQQFVKENYLPRNATLVIVGDFELDEAQSMLYANFEPTLLDPTLTAADFAEVPAPGVTNPSQDRPEDWRTVIYDHADHTRPLNTEARLTPRVSGPAEQPPMPHDQVLTRHKAPIDKPFVIVAWTVPGAYRGSDATLGVMASIAGSYMSAYFEQSDPTVQADESGCFLWDSKIDSKVICAIAMKDSEGVDPDRIAEKAVDQISLMWNPEYNYDPVANVRYLDVMLSRYRMERLAQILRSLDLFASVGSGRATDIAHHAHFTGSASYQSDEMKETMTITGPQIAALAEAYLRRNRYVKIYIEPLGKDDELASQGAYRGANQGDLTRSLIDPARITPEVIRDITVTPDPSKVVDKTLPNGLRVVVFPHGEAPLVEVGLLVGGGNASTPLGLDSFADEFMTTVWNDPTRKSDPLRIAGSWQTVRYDNQTYHSVQGSSGNVDGALWLMRQAMEELRPNLEGKAAFVTAEKSAMKHAWTKRDLFVTSDRSLFVNPGHPLLASADLDGDGDPDELSWDQIVAREGWGSSDVAKYLATKYQPANATLLVVGNVDPKKAMALAEYYFQGWAPRPAAVVGRVAPIGGPNPATSAPVIRVYDDPSKTQTQVTFACQLATTAPTDDVKLRILGDTLDDLAWVALRENGGVTYGANAQTIQYVGGSAALVMSTLVQNDGVALAVQTFEALSKKASAGDFDPSAIQAHKLSLAERYGLSQQSVPQMRGRLLQQLIFGKDWATMAAYGDRLAAVEASQLGAVVGDCDQHFIIQLEGPQDQITSELDEAGLPYETRDWKQAGRDLLAKHDPSAYKKMIKAEQKEKAKGAAKKASSP